MVTGLALDFSKLGRRLLGVCSILLAASSGCVDDPVLRSCAEFELGTAECGEGCEIYCDLLATSCPAAGADSDDGRAACLATCSETLADTGELGDESGDTLQCRIRHALLAESDPEGHCDAASFEGGGICVDVEGCSEYCELMALHCEGAYPNEQNCMATCVDMPISESDRDANTRACRLKYARQAEASSSKASCTAASLNGGATCGDPCDAYCDHVLVNCTGEHAIYANRSACVTTCRMLDTDGNFDDWRNEKDTIQCRSYHASAPAGVDPATHCPHADVYNVAHCGDRCQVFCGLMRRACEGSFESDEACEAACQSISVDDPLYPQSGNNQTCGPAGGS